MNYTPIKNGESIEPKLQEAEAEIIHLRNRNEELEGARILNLNAIDRLREKLNKVSEIAREREVRVNALSERVAQEVRENSDARNKALEDAAKVVSDCSWGDYWVLYGMLVAPCDLAAIIREMKEK